MVISPRTGSAVLVGLCVIALAACTRDGVPVGSGPLSAGEGTFKVGASTPAEGRVPSLGTVILSNESSTEVAILDEVRLGNPQGLTVEQAYVLPALEEVNFGGGFALPSLAEGFPYPHQDEQWAARDAFAGFEIGPGDARNLLIGLGWTGSCGGTAAWVEVDYSVGNNEFTAVSDTAFELIPVDGAVCP